MRDRYTMLIELLECLDSREVSEVERFARDKVLAKEGARRLLPLNWHKGRGRVYPLYCRREQSPS